MKLAPIDGFEVIYYPTNIFHPDLGRANSEIISVKMRLDMPKIDFSEPRTHRYPVIIHREGNVWGYHSPSFGGGGAASQEAALSSAQELLDSAVAELSARGAVIPLPTPPDQVNADGAQVVWLPVIVSGDRLA
ncbi:MAG: hypothetical protein WBB85_21425 [Albidovulum sp.]